MGEVPFMKWLCSCHCEIKKQKHFFFVVVNQRKENSKEGRISVNFVGCLKMTVLHITHLYVVFLVLYCNVKVIYDAI